MSWTLGMVYPTSKNQSDALATQVHQYVANGQLNYLQRHLRQYPADIRLMHTSGKSLVITACIHNQDKILKYLLSKDQSLADLADANGMTPFHHTAWHNSIDCAKILVENGATNINELDVYGRSAIHIATQWSQWPIIPVLVQLGCKHLNMPNAQGRAPIHDVTMNNEDLNIFWQLLSLGADILAMDCNGQTVLHYACSNPKTIEAILQIQPAFLDQVDHAGWTAFHCAASRGYVPSVETMLILANRRQPGSASRLVLPCMQGSMILPVGRAVDVHNPDHLPREQDEYIINILNLSEDEWIPFDPQEHIHHMSPDEIAFASQIDHPRILQLLFAIGADLDITMAELEDRIEEDPMEADKRLRVARCLSSSEILKIRNRIYFSGSLTASLLDNLD